MKDLAQYLTEYMEQEIEVRNSHKMQALLKEALEAYQSTENCIIEITGGNCPECDIPMEKQEASTFDGTGNHLECFKYECSECGYEIYC